ncbi:transporter substrate-binding domain-containing protein [Psychromonas aquimarina]|uniref:transporter substrate-binding domain-containing protein n=1 Tax=Psychromonas aquimarina TaxID=444919 RepID=UPI00040B883F|nr:transporter substrate-binding domain-containing protein [Psychromonas aquimarina]
MASKRLKQTLPGIVLLIHSLPIAASAAPQTVITWTSEIWPKVSQENKRGAYFDLLKAVYPEPQFELVHRFLPYKRGINFVRQGRMDLFSLCSPVSGFIKPKYAWAQESIGVLFDPQVINNWQGVTSLDKHTVTVNKEISILPFVQSINAKLIKTDSRARSLTLLQKNRADFFLGFKINIEFELNKSSRIKMQQYKFQPLQVISCYPGFSSSAKGLRLSRLWDEGIERLHNSGELKKIYQKWQLEYPGGDAQ